MYGNTDSRELEWLVIVISIFEPSFLCAEYSFKSFSSPDAIFLCSYVKSVDFTCCHFYQIENHQYCGGGKLWLRIWGATMESCGRLFRGGGLLWRGHNTELIYSWQEYGEKVMVWNQYTVVEEAFSANGERSMHNKGEIQSWKESKCAWILLNWFH